MVFIRNVDAEINPAVNRQNFNIWYYSARFVLNYNLGINSFSALSYINNRLGRRVSRNGDSAKTETFKAKVWKLLGLQKHWKNKVSKNQKIIYTWDLW